MIAFRNRAFFLTFLIPVVLTGCPGLNPPGNNGPGKNATTLRRFESSFELLDYIKEQARARTDGFGIYRSDALDGGALGLAGAPTSEGAEDSATTGADDAGGDYTTTNIQEAGVDESDVIKSDGTNLYIARGQTVRIVRASPPDQLAEIGRVQLPAQVDSMYLYGSKLIVLGQEYSYGVPGVAMPEIWPPFYRGADLLVTQLDVSNPAAPQIVAQTKLEGSLVSSRLTNDRLILVVTIYPKLPENPTPLAINTMQLDDVMPTVESDGAASDLVTPTDWYRPDVPDGFVMSAVVTLDAADVRNKIASIGVVGDVGTIYASTKALYLTDDGYDADNGYREYTTIHKLAFDDAGAAQYVATGTVPGRLLNQFSLGEHAGNLRVATHVSGMQFFIEADVAVAGVGVGSSTGTGADDVAEEDIADSSTTDAAPSGPSNGVYVLAESDGKLAVTGKIENIAPGENLYAARFLGARGFLVTFVQVDPLFVLDLSDPADPKIAGELKIPGYSDYLHPLGEDRMIGVGRSTRRSEWGGVLRDAVQLSLFDVSDPANPALIQQISVGGYGSSSEVSVTHKAFTLRTRDNVLAIPATLWNGDGVAFEGDYGPEFDGVLCYRIDPDAGFTALGRLASVLGDDGYYGYGWTLWRRAALIDQTLYALTQDGVRATSLDDFNAAHELQLERTEDEYSGGYGGDESDVAENPRR